MADERYRAQAAEALRDTTNDLYLLPAAYNNLMRAVRELEEGGYKPQYIAGYLTLFSFYLTYRMTGQYSMVGPLFESPVSLKEPATIAETRRILAQLSGKQAETSEGAGQPFGRPPVLGTGTAEEPVRTRPIAMSTGLTRHPRLRPLFPSWREQARSLVRFVRKWALVFWLAVSIAGLVIAVVPEAFAIKVVLSSALVGAGVAGLLSEFTYLPDRCRAHRALKEQKERYTNLNAHIGRVDGLLKKADITMINQMFKLGVDLAQVRFGQPEKVNSFAAEAKELSDFMGLAAAVEKFLRDPYLRPAENPPLPDQDPMRDLMNAVTLRYAREAAAAFKAGYAYGALLHKFSTTAVDMLKDAIDLLYLPPTAHANMQRAIQELKADAYKPGEFLLYLVLFSMYLKYRVTGANKEVAPLFESPVSLTEPGTAAEVHRLVENVRSAGPGQSATRSGDTPQQGGAAVAM